MNRQEAEVFAELVRELLTGEDLIVVYADPYDTVVRQHETLRSIMLGGNDDDIYIHLCDSYSVTIERGDWNFAPNDRAVTFTGQTGEGKPYRCTWAITTRDDAHSEQVFQRVRKAQQDWWRRA